MSDRYNCELLIGGKLTQSKVKELVDMLCMSEWYVQWDDGGGSDESRLIDELKDSDGTNPHFTQHDTAVPLQDELFDFLQENKLAYHFHISSDGVYDGEIQWWYPDYASTKSARADVNATASVATRDELRKLLSDGLTLAQVVGAMDDMPPTLPKFIIVKDEPST